MFRRILILLGLVLALALPASAEKLMPFDNSGEAPGFAAFKQKLLAAIKKRDARFIHSIISPSIDFSFGGKAGAAQFRKEFRPDDPRSPFWPELEKILKLGGSWDKKQGVVWFPSLFDRWPENLDGLEYAAVIAPDVPLKKAPSASAETLQTLSWDIVRFLRDPGDTDTWKKVQAPDRTTGWVQASQIHSPGWRRARFARVKGRWMLATYIIGD